MVQTESLLEKISDILTTYTPSPEKIELVKETPITVLVGISGAGKDTIKHKLLDSGNYHHIVSHTTRPPRENKGVMEQDGREYHFIDVPTSLDMLEAGEYIEANVYSNNVYGTSISEIEKAKQDGIIAIGDIDVHGVANFKRLSDRVIALFILPPNFEEWQRRLLARYGEGGADPVDIAKRMVTAINELEHALIVPYYHFIVNSDLDRAVHAADSIAHNHDTFNKVDDEVREQAKILLEDIKTHLNS